MSLWTLRAVTARQFAGNAWNQLSQRVSTLETNSGSGPAVRDVSDSLETVTTSVTNVSTSVATLTTSVANVSTSVATLTTSVANVSTSVATLTTSVANVSTSVATLTTSVANVSTSVATLTTSVGTVSTSLSNVSTSLSNATSDIASASTRITTLETSLPLIGERYDIPDLTTLLTHIRALPDTVDAYVAPDSTETNFQVHDMMKTSDGRSLLTVGEDDGYVKVVRRGKDSDTYSTVLGHMFVPKTDLILDPMMELGVVKASDVNIVGVHFVRVGTRDKLAVFTRILTTTMDEYRDAVVLYDIDSQSLERHYLQPNGSLSGPSPVDVTLVSGVEPAGFVFQSMSGASRSLVLGATLMTSTGSWSDMTSASLKTGTPYTPGMWSSGMIPLNLWFESIPSQQVVQMSVARRAFRYNDSADLALAVGIFQNTAENEQDTTTMQLVAMSPRAGVQRLLGNSGLLIDAANARWTAFMNEINDVADPDVTFPDGFPTLCDVVWTESMSILAPALPEHRGGELAKEARVALYFPGSAPGAGFVGTLVVWQDTGSTFVHPRYVTPLWNDDTFHIVRMHWVSRTKLLLVNRQSESSFGSAVVWDTADVGGPVVFAPQNPTVGPVVPESIDVFTDTQFSETSEDGPAFVTLAQVPSETDFSLFVIGKNGIVYSSMASTLTITGITSPSDVLFARCRFLDSYRVAYSIRTGSTSYDGVWTFDD